jgi:hypothetical protein
MIVRPILVVGRMLSSAEAALRGRSTTSMWIGRPSGIAARALNGAAESAP